MKRILVFCLLLFLLALNCSKDHGGKTTPTDNNSATKELTIFFVNDQHGQLNNFPKIKYIVDQERKTTNVIVACSGDMFSGNPAVDYYPEKGYPMIDVMNRVGFDISVVGNHEFDYGTSILADRMNQANFEWVCANVDMGNSGVPEPFEYKTISVDNVNVTFLGLVETNGKDNGIIPSTHPWRVQNLTFDNPKDVIFNYSEIKKQENSDLYIALTHLGYSCNCNALTDSQIATQYPYFDMIIGGHSHQIINTTINNIPLFQSGSYLHDLGKIELTIKDSAIESVNYELINLDNYSSYDVELKNLVDTYNDLPYLDDIIGYSYLYHEKPKVGCFYTDALREAMSVDITFQNTGGIRSTLDEGDITVREIYEMDPFSNGTVIYDMTVSEIKEFLMGSGSGFYYSGVQIEQLGNSIEIKDMNNTTLSNDYVLTLGINDYIPAVWDNYFPVDGTIQPLDSADTIIYYLENINNEVNYPNCSRYFRYQ